VGPPRSLRSQVLLRDPDEDAEEIATPTRSFSVWEITSGLPDDSREEDERAVKRELREVRARVKAARAVVASSPARLSRSFVLAPRSTGSSPASWLGPVTCAMKGCMR
jgi:hypothetical protein